MNVAPGTDGLTLDLVKDGSTVASVPVTPPAMTHQFATTGPGRYRIELREGQLVWALTSPIWIID
jgi:hypothetical protein